MNTVVLILLLSAIVLLLWAIRKWHWLNQDLRESEERFRLLIEQAPEATFLYHGDSGRVLNCNARACELFGASREALIEKGPQSFYLEDQPDHLPLKESHSSYHSRALQGEVVQFQRAIENGEEEQLLCEVQLSMLPSRKQKLLHQSFINITERINLENQLLQAEKMQAIGQLTGGIAHDFNNQLSSILGYVEILRRRFPDEKLQSYVNYIEVSARRSCELTQQLLTFCRKGPQNSTITAVTPLLEEVVSILGRSIDKNITINLHPKAGDVFVLADSAQLQNAFINLALNARDAMPEGGTLSFVTDIVTLGKGFCLRHGYDVDSGDYLKISVNDTGCGIDKKNQAKIFEPFFTTKPIGKGTGMGLASVYSTVLSHKGHINVYSEVNKGTSFHLYLPLAEGKTEGEEQGKVTPPLQGSGHLLVVDDEELVRQMTAEILEDLGYRVTEACNGMEALRIYQSGWQQFDLALLDMVMPEMNGRDAFVAMREINPGIKAILCSGYSMDENSDTLKALGFKGFVGKPFTSLELSSTIAKVLQDE